MVVAFVFQMALSILSWIALDIYPLSNYLHSIYTVINPLYSIHYGNVYENLLTDYLITILTLKNTIFINMILYLKIIRIDNVTIIIDII